MKQKIDLTTQVLLESNQSQMKDNIVKFLKLSLFKKGNENPVFDNKKIDRIIEAIVLLKKWSCDNYQILEIGVDYGDIVSISLIGEDIIINDMSKFSEICSFASNMEIYPRTDETVVIDFTFHNILIN